ncbi:hypothetical protein [Streptomyces sp. NPDC002889]|uniref:hypothetical protein n=1 Tax=Streptomyces sp. NPDC002889 TaxID=3364669 RepID=UPI00367C64CE
MAVDEGVQPWCQPAAESRPIASRRGDRICEGLLRLPFEFDSGSRRAQLLVSRTLSALTSATRTRFLLVLVWPALAFRPNG